MTSLGKSYEDMSLDELNEKEDDVDEEEERIFEEYRSVYHNLRTTCPNVSTIISFVREDYNSIGSH